MVWNHIDWLADWMTDRPTNWTTDWLIDIIYHQWNHTHEIYILTNMSVYHGFPLRWFILTITTTVTQLSTISRHGPRVHCQCRLSSLFKGFVVAWHFSESVMSLLTVHCFTKVSKSRLILNAAVILALSTRVHRSPQLSFIPSTTRSTVAAVHNWLSEGFVPPYKDTA